MSSRLVRDQTLRKLVSPAVTQDWILWRGVHRLYTLPAWVVLVNSEYLLKVAIYSMLSPTISGVQYRLRIGENEDVQSIQEAKRARKPRRNSDATLAWRHVPRAGASVQ
jgi:hypothetical protein